MVSAVKEDHVSELFSRWAVVKEGGISKCRSRPSLSPCQRNAVRVG